MQSFRQRGSALPSQHTAHWLNENWEKKWEGQRKLSRRTSVSTFNDTVFTGSFVSFYLRDTMSTSVCVWVCLCACVCVRARVRVCFALAETTVADTGQLQEKTPEDEKLDFTVKNVSFCNTWRSLLSVRDEAVRRSSDSHVRLVH